jgi:hypothetical protein
LIIGGLLTSSEELHPLLLLDCGGGVVQDRTICDAAAEAVGTANIADTKSMRIMLPTLREYRNTGLWSLIFSS